MPIQPEPQTLSETMQPPVFIDKGFVPGSGSPSGSRQSRGRRRFATVVLLSAALLSACDPSWYAYGKEQPLLSSEGVSRVELVHYDNPSATEYIDIFRWGGNGGLKPFSMKKMEVRKTIDRKTPGYETGERYSDLMRDLSRLELWNTWGHVDAPNGICIRVVHDRGDFDVISRDIVIRYNAEGKIPDGFWSGYIGAVVKPDQVTAIVDTYFR